MPVASNYQAALILDAAKGTAPAALTTWTPYAAIMTTTPLGDATGGVEVSTSSSGYSRQLCGFGAATAVSNGSGGGSQAVNAAQISFGTATSNWGTPTAICIYDAVTGGNLRYIIPFSGSTISNGNGPVTIAAGALVLKHA
jgi:hypothetical protein